MEAVLLAAIAAAPDDDAPRMVYADHLLQQGDARGELINLQCALARADDADEPFDAAMVARERQLLAEHADIWTIPLRAELDAGYQFRRGLVEHVSAWRIFDVAKYPAEDPEDPESIIDIRALVDRLGEVMIKAPLLRSLAVRAEAFMYELPRSWAALHALHLTESGYSAPEAITAALQRVPALRRLHLTSASIGGEQLAAFLDAPQVLEHLGVHIGWHVSARPEPGLATERIANNAALHELRSLHLAGFKLDELDRLVCLSRLQRLAIDRCSVTPNELIALVAQLPSLTMLEYQFHDTDKIELDLPTLLAAAPKLRRLALANVTLTAPASLANTKLRRVILDRCGVDDGDAKAILDGLADAIEIQINDDGLTTLETQYRLGERALRYRPTPPRAPPKITEVLPTNKIMAVKEYRELTGSGLADAKMAVERIDEERTGRAAYNLVRAQSRWCRP